MVRIALSVLVAACALGAGAPAAADEAPMRRIVVTSSGLDLTTEAGAETMVARIDRAATQACGGMPNRAAEIEEFDACREDVMVQAVTALRAPLVSLVYAETHSTPQTTHLASR